MSFLQAKQKKHYETEQYLSYIYNSTDGFVTLANINGADFRDIFYKTSQLHKNISNITGCNDTYTSINTFISPRIAGRKDSGRTVNGVKKLNALYIDIDCYKLGLSQDAVLFYLQNDYFDRTIPLPTYCINSGRGIYLIWKIGPQAQSALKAWNATEKYLCNALKDLGADPMATDAARILRVPGTINSKSNTLVTIIDFNDIIYNLYDIISEYNIDISAPTKAIRTAPSAPERKTYPYGQATHNMRYTAAVIAQKYNVTLPDFANYKATYDFIGQYYKPNYNNKIINFANCGNNFNDILTARVRDLFRLFSQRKGEDCRREYGLFLCRLWVAEATKNYEYALKKTLELNAMLDAPFSEDYVIKRTASAEKKVRAGSTYAYKSGTISRILRLNENEKVLYPALCVKNYSRCEKNRKAYLSRLYRKNKIPKADEIKMRREKIIDLLADSTMSRTDICAILNISIRTLARDISAIKTTSQQPPAINNATLFDKILTVMPIFKPPYYKKGWASLTLPLPLGFSIPIIAHINSS